MTTSSSIVEKHSFTLTWDFDLDVNDTTTNLQMPLKTRFGEIVLRVTLEGPQRPVLDARLAAVDP
jgi:hypothetical protein